MHSSERLVRATSTTTTATATATATAAATASLALALGLGLGLDMVSLCLIESTWNTKACHRPKAKRQNAKFPKRTVMRDDINTGMGT
jgi:hypothetical protein